MSLEWLRTSMEVKQVDGLQRIISGYAAVVGNIDLGNDIIEPGAFRKTLRDKQPADIGVFIGHDTSGLPMGIPLVLREDGKGLYSETLVKPGPAGDDLLATAQFMAAHGRPLGQSIGYRVAPGGAKTDRVNGRMVRRLGALDLHEYSFASGMAVMNPEALTTGVKTGDGMGDYTVEQRGDKFHAVRKSDGQSMGSYDTEAAAKAACEMHAGGGKTVLSAADINDLPDSAFLHVEAGGVLDDEGKTVPRANRHFRFRDAAGALDGEALAVTLTRIPEAKTIGLDPADLARLHTRVRRMVDAIKRGDDPQADADQWKAGLPVELLTLAYGLLDVAAQAVAQHKALAVIGDDVKGGWKVRGTGLGEIKALYAQFGRVIEQADLVAAGKDEEAQADWWRAQFDFLEVAS